MLINLSHIFNILIGRLENTAGVLLISRHQQQNRFLCSNQLPSVKSSWKAMGFEDIEAAQMKSEFNLACRNFSFGDGA
ncbi:unnamed protein product [Caretta caretta]